MNVIKRILLVLFLSGIIGLCQNAFATPTNHFLPIGNDQQAITVSAQNNGLSDGWYFGVADFDGVFSNGLKLLEGNNVSNSKFKITKNEDSGDWILEITSGVDNGSTLNLGNSEDIKFFYFDGNNYYEPEEIEWISPDQYLFTYNNSNGVLVVDVKAVVPLPASLFLFSIGCSFFLFGRIKGE